MTENTGWGSSSIIGGFIVLLILFALFNNGGLFGARNVAGCDVTTNCQVEKQTIINTATLQYETINQGNMTREAVMKDGEATRAKIDFYAYQDLRDKLAEEQRKSMSLENRLYSNEQFNTLSSQITALSCETLKKPDVRGIGAACPSASVLNGLGINSNPFCNGAYV